MLWWPLRSCRLLLESNEAELTFLVTGMRFDGMTELPHSFEEVDQLLRNAELRDALEPFLDEAVDLVDIRRMSTRTENEFLASMLAWERAPVLPISQWFDPELVLPHPDSLSDSQLHETLWYALEKLSDQKIVLEYTDHLSDRALYCLLYRDILPSPEKKVDLPKNYLHWHCIDDKQDVETWLKYYASHEQREIWASENDAPLVPVEPLPYPRRMPRRPPMG